MDTDIMICRISHADHEHISKTLLQ